MAWLVDGLVVLIALTAADLAELDRMLVESGRVRPLQA